MDDKEQNEIVHGYEIKRSVVFDNERGIAFAENPRAVHPFVTWMFSEDENGKRSYEWGRYTTNRQAAESDYHARISRYILDYSVSERTANAAPETPDVYKYYSTQRPVDIGTYPKFDSEPVSIKNYDERISVENGAFRAWGELSYSVALTKKQIDDYELRAAPGNPDRLHLTPEQAEQQAQVVGKWEKSKRIPDVRRLTWWYPDFGVFIKKEFVTDEQLSERCSDILSRQKNKSSIAEQIKTGTDKAVHDNAALPKHTKRIEKDR